jgi:hypothetical protein
MVSDPDLSPAPRRVAGGILMALAVGVLLTAIGYFTSLRFLLAPGILISGVVFGGGMHADSVSAMYRFAAGVAFGNVLAWAAMGLLAWRAVERERVRNKS